ncbi:hypothetical protein NX862_07310 [Rhodobacter sp. KR11]|uniref:hypothetical protein n=1 Tax=Rhodobacter sp. KR11 TaxID=2974588 RepID=UPI0022232514|nr:hypothetical protein [Rhodobacter sp. KR11]MCW1918555.1 hypothetical protein [Rhodobacter sp. KR11]
MIRLLSLVAWTCWVFLVLGVIWAAGRGIELTDEAYYILSALHPDQVTLYVSAQHWTLAPLWAVTQSLLAFRLLGAAILLGSAGVLALGLGRALGALGRPLGAGQGAMVAAAGVGALLYVATIAPSPSYNLLASAGAYGAVGLALMALAGRGGWSLLAGLALAVCLVNKPSAGVSVALVILGLVLVLQPNRRGALVLAGGIAGTLALLVLMVALQPATPGVWASLQGGLELFRQVQTEPVGARLWRYGETLAWSFGGGLYAFAPALAALALWWVIPRRWMLLPALAAGLWTLSAYGNHLGGMQSYQAMAEAIYVAVAAVAVMGLGGGALPGRVRLVILALLVLPFAITVGTGNSLFTQVVVALAPWTLAVTALACLAPPDKPRSLGPVAVSAALLILLTVQITTSYLRDPYHLAAPLTGQTRKITMPELGALQVDPQTETMLTQARAAIQACDLKPGAAFFGLYNVPGLALALQAVPPVSPWLNNAAQAHSVMAHWTEAPGQRRVLALSPEALAALSDLPPALRPAAGYRFCGPLTFPYNGQPIQIWASP